MVNNLHRKLQAVVTIDQLELAEFIVRHRFYSSPVSQTKAHDTRCA